MKTTFKLLAAVAAIGTFGFVSQAHATDETADASVVIQTPITISEDVSLDFATIQRDVAGETVTLAPSTAALSSTGAGVFSGVASDATFTASGDPSTAVTITYTPGTLTGPGTAMAVNNFADDAGVTPTTNGSGDLTFNVGADLVINAAQASGSYAGTYTVSVNY